MREFALYQLELLLLPAPPVAASFWRQTTASYLGLGYKAGSAQGLFLISVETLARPGDVQ